MNLIGIYIIVIAACTVLVPIGYDVLKTLVNYIGKFLYDGNYNDWDPIHNRLGKSTIPILAGVGFAGSLGFILLLNFPAYTFLLAVVAAVVIAMLFLARAVIRLGGRRD